MRYIIIKQALLVVAAISFALTAAAQTISAVPESVELYARDMNSALGSSGPASLETTFEEGLLAAEALERDQLARLDEPTYRKVQRMMTGFWVSREDVILAAPNPDFYLKLAREKGTSVDQAFFKALKKTYPEDRWPAYKEALTEYGGCTVFDGKTLSGIYEAWIAFQKAYPGRYRGGVRKEVARIEAALESLFVCGGEDEYRRELQSFLKTYPTSPVASRVASRLEAVNNHTSEIRFHCKSY